MSKAAFRSMLKTSVAVKGASQTITTNLDPKEVSWSAITGSPANMMVAGRGSWSQARGWGEANALFGLFPSTTHVLYYDADDVTLEPEKVYQFEWTDAHSQARVARGMAPESMGGLDGYMRIAVTEVFVT